MAKKKKGSAKKRSVKKPARAKKPSRKKGGAKKPAATLDALARKIVRLTQNPSFGEAEIQMLYHPDCTSQEGTGSIDRGYAGLEEKGKRWNQMQSGTIWKAKNVWVRGSTICIEWDATVTLRDGRTVKMPEIAVHEIAKGKIKDERFYYNPLVLAPPTS
jgi:SnoaL-like protein